MGFGSNSINWATGSWVAGDGVAGDGVTGDGVTGDGVAGRRFAGAQSLVVNKMVRTRSSTRALRLRALG